MSAIYVVLPLTNETIDWLTYLEIESITVTRDARFPTPKEIKKSIEILNLSTDYFIGENVWQVTVDDPDGSMWTHIVVTDFQGDENLSHEFHFESGWPELAVRILKELSKSCGSFVLIPDTSEQPIFVMTD